MTAGPGRHGQSGLHPARECVLRKNVTPRSGSLVGTESQGRAPYPQRTSLTLSWPRPKAQEWTSASRTRS